MVDAFLSSVLLAAGSQLPTNRSGIQKIIKATASRLDKKHSPNFTLKSQFASSLFGERIMKHLDMMKKQFMLRWVVSHIRNGETNSYLDLFCYKVQNFFCTLEMPFLWP